MSTVESAEMSTIRGAISLAIPSAAPRDEGPAEGTIDPDYSEIYLIMLEQMRCDTNPIATDAECDGLIQRLPAA